MPVDLPTPRAAGAREHPGDGYAAGPPPGGAVRPLALRLPDGRRLVLGLLDLGLACCALEVAAAWARLGEPADPGAAVDVLLVSGTVTDAVAPAVAALHARLGAPAVVSVGACSNAGGPYWDSPVVTNGVDQLVPVALALPGCPPRPEQVVDAVLRLAGEPAAGQSSAGER